MTYLLALASRYGALAVQFAIVLLVANRLPQTEAGLYFTAFGLVSTFFCVAGLGLPDGLVIKIGHMLSNEKLGGIRDAVNRSIFRSLLSAIVLFGGGAILATVLGASFEFAALTALWGVAYGIVFAASQGLIALRRAQLGTFFFYGATNFCFAFTSVPYLLAASAPSLDGLMKITVLAATIAAAGTFFVLFLTTRPYLATEREDISDVERAGAVIAISRMLQSSLYWVPVWVATLILGSAQAAVIATAGRLLIAVSAVIAALRFSVRPAIVKASSQNDWKGIEKLGRRISLATTVFTVLAILAFGVAGKPALGFLLGPEYAASWVVLLILLVGALGEAFGGPVDEILKMTGHGKTVLFGLIAAVLFETAIAFAMSPHGILAIAIAQSTAFVAMYLFQIYQLSRLRGILIVPFLVSKE